MAWEMAWEMDWEMDWELDWELTCIGLLPAIVSQVGLAA
jgi:hypothetical protein